MMKAKKGFTLVEILIVVVILGILAAIVIPQFTGASTEAKLSSLVSDLQSIRSQVELYKLQHNEGVPSWTLVADPGTGEMVNGLTGATLINGTHVATGTDDSYGPYLMKMPTNQFNNLDTIVADGTIGDATIGWVYRTSDRMVYPAFIDMDGDNVSDGTETSY
ncbi:MAG: prepilin-type N-terminal cleavage/methylation domain-containing protein [Phycisphaerae bacterium]|jgi:general secretion pathway protein G